MYIYKKENGRSISRMILATINYIKKTLHISASKSNYQRPDLLQIHASGMGGRSSCTRLRNIESMKIPHYIYAK